MYIIQDGYQPDFAAFFFVFTTLTGSFFMLNLALAIVFDVMVKIHQEEAEENVKNMLMQFFNAMDSDSKGYLSLEDMRNAQYYKRLRISNEKLELLFKKIDINKNGQIDFGEFETFSKDAFEDDIISLSKSLSKRVAGGWKNKN